MRARILQRADLPVDATNAEPAGHADRVDLGQVPGRTVARLALVGGDPANVDPGLVGEAAGTQGLGHRQVGVVQVDVLADQRDGDLLLGVVHPVEQVVPAGPVDVAERQSEAADDIGVQALGVQHLGNVVDRRGVDGGDDGLGVHVAHHRDLALHRLRDEPVGPADDGVGLDADRAECGNRVLGRLGLQLPRGGHVRHQRDVQEEAVLPAHVVADLTRCLEEREGLDVADGSADLGDHHVDIVGRHRPDAVLDLVGDVRDHLDGVAQVVTATLAGDDVGVHLPRRDVGEAREVRVQEALIVADVEVGLGAVVGHEHLAVLEGVHRPRIDVEVRVELLHRHTHPACLQQAAQRGGGEPLPQGGRDSSGDENVLRGLGSGQRNSRGWSGQDCDKQDLRGLAEALRSAT